VTRKGGLGKGLGALIPPGAAEGLGAGGYQELPVSTIRANRYQPREHFGEEQLSALADSIREVGVLQPVLVRPADDGYELVVGAPRGAPACRRSPR
jgi:ParB family transcriptional regulator, chromosome partitioning protein